MDLAALDASKEDGALLALRHPGNGSVLKTADEKPISLTVVGTDSEIYRSAMRALTNKRLTQVRRDPVTAEEIESEATSMLANCVTGWSGIVLDGQPLQFSKANVVVIFSRLRWVREQVEAFVNDRANFVKA